MKVLVVLAHPNPDSFSHAIVDKVSATLTDCDHSVSVVDLYAIGYSPTMTRAELAAYPTSEPAIDPMVNEHTHLIQECSAIVFVYPTWWSSMPAILKGWIDRTILPGVAFSVDPQTLKLQPELTNVRRLIGITTFGGPRLASLVVRDNGSKIVTRSLRAICHQRCRTTWLRLFNIDSSTPAEREKFLQCVERTLRKI
jgi:putative NADPH-quinone reductase